MKYLVMLILFLLSILNVFGNEILTGEGEIVFVQYLSFEQQKEIEKMRMEFLERFNEVRRKLILVKMETQNEMRKENPNWNEINKLNREYSKLQKILNEGVSEYKEKLQSAQIEIIN